MAQDYSNLHTKICIISPSLKMGGIERALTVLANNFIQYGYNISFISCLNSNAFYSLDERIELIQPDFFRSKSKLNKILFYFRLAQFVRKEVKKINPDTILSFGDKFNPLVLIALLGTGYPVYISDRTSPDFPFSKTIKILKKYLYPLSAGFIAQTTRAANNKRRIFGDKLNIITIPNAIRDVNNTGEVRQNVIICVARLVKEKNHERLLNAFAAFSDHESWKLTLIGDGPLRTSLIKQAESLGILKFVEFVGDTKDVDKYLSLSSIFVLPSHIEGFPNALCEAMANGLPVICFDTIPFEDIISHGKEGFVVKNNSVEELTSCLELLANNAPLRSQMGGAAKQKVEKFQSHEIANRYLKFILSKCKN